jgi:type VI secretion system protein VasG
LRVDPKRLVRRLTPTATRMMEGAVGRAASSQHAEVTVEHFLLQMLTAKDSESFGILKEAGRDPDALRARIERTLERRSTTTSRPVFSETLFRWIEDAWLTASIEHGEQRVRTGLMMIQLLKSPGRYSGEGYPELDGVSVERLQSELDAILGATPEAIEAAPPSGNGASAAPAGGAPREGGALERFCTDFTAAAKAGKIDPVFGRHGEIRQMIDILSRRRKNNPILVGEPGVGKTALVEGLARELVAGNVPDSLKTTRLVGLDLGLLQAGASMKGEFENRLKAVISEVKASEVPMILFIDEAHTMIGAGGSAGGSDAANLLKPALARGELRTVAATTWAEYKKYFEKDAALERRFQPVKVDEPSEDVAVGMLRGLRPIYEKAHSVRILDEAVVAAVELSHRYISGRQLPDKAVDLLDTTAARVRVEREAKPSELVDVEQHIASLERRRDGLEMDRTAGYTIEPETMAELQSQLEELAARRDEIHTRWEKERQEVAALLEAREGEGATPEVLRGDRLVHVDVDADAVARTVSSWTGIPLGKVMHDTVSTVLELEDKLRSRVVGQAPAVEAVSRALQASYAGVRDPNTPVGVMLFVGPSGVGKTETALALADLVYGGERFMTTINMSEFMEKHSVSRLIGSPPGYVGYGEGGVLSEAVRQRPYSVVLLDECEKADPEVMNLFYQVFDKGTLNDGEGRPIDFKNTMIILTSNLASDQIMELYNRDEPPPVDDVVSSIRPALSAHFKPALLARMTIVPYRPIDRSSMRSITELKLRKLTSRIRTSHGFDPVVEEAVLEEIVRRCTEAETGARNIDHILRGTLLPSVSRALLEVMADGEKPTGLVVGLGPDGRFRVDVDSEGE